MRNSIFNLKTGWLLIAITLVAFLSGGRDNAVGVTIFDNEAAYNAAISAQANLVKKNINLPGDGSIFVSPPEVQFSRTGPGLLTSFVFSELPGGKALFNPFFVPPPASVDDFMVIDPGVGVLALGFNYLLGEPLSGTDPLGSPISGNPTFTISTFLGNFIFSQKTNTPGDPTNEIVPFFGMIDDVGLPTIRLALTGDGDFAPFQTEFISNISFATVSEVPLPMSLPLYGMGLAVMGFIGWKRKRKMA